MVGRQTNLSADGNVLAVGDTGDDSNAIGVNGDPANGLAQNSGAVFLFRRIAGVWSQEAYLKASNTGRLDYFGGNVSLSDDGNTLAVAAFGEGSNAKGVNGNQADNSAASSGAVYVFHRMGTSWIQSDYLKAPNTEMGDNFGASLALSGDGNTIASAALFDASNATGVNGNSNDNSAARAGSVDVFRY